ncbi:MAG: ankyrin repeat domain-containing protein, partial [Gammaproteobacteria bacterium]|nr:ankyrin repeat domain-containing protein [Gammaproteobacteria bacterium]
LKTGLSFTALELGDIAALTAVLEEVQRRWSGEQKDLAADDESRGVQAIRPHFSNISLLGGAISLDDLKSIALLVNTFRVSVNKDFDKVEMSPLHVACSKTMALKPSSPEVVALLLALGASVNAQRNNDNATPLHCAVACGDALSQKRIQLLLEAGAKVTAQDNQGRTPLHLYILSQGAWHNKAKAWDDNDRTILCNLIEAGKQQGISQDKLMNMTDSQGDNALHYIAASTQLSEQIAVDLLELGVNPSTCNAQGHSPLHLLCVRNEPRAGIFLKQIKTVCGDVADYLCGCRDQSGGTILHFILMQILKHQFFQNIFSELFSVLSPREIQRFVNIKNHQDRTAFHEILINLSSVTEEERTTKLSSFELSLKKEVLAQLIQADEEGNTLFHQLAATNDISSLQTLDRFLTHYKEHTRGDELVLSPFMQANNGGHTPQDIARNEGHTEFLSLLQDEGFAKPQYEKDALARSKAWQERVTQEKQQREAEITKRKEEEQRRSEAIARQKEEEQRYAEERDRQTRLQALNEAKVQIDTGIDRLTPHLTNLKSKIADLTHRKVNKLFGTYSGVAKDIADIVTDIDKLTTDWNHHIPPTPDPTNRITTLCQQSAAVLKKLKDPALWHQVNQHRGLRIALLNIAILIAGVVLISLIVLAIRQKITSSASFFVNPSHPTDTANKVSAVKTTLESIQFLAQSAVPTPAHVPNV